MNRDGQNDLKFRLTVPFGCPFKKPQDEIPIDCTMEIILAYPPNGKCTGQAIVGVSKCGKTVRHSTWNETQVLTAKHHGSTEYILIKDYEIYLRAQKPGGAGKYWENTTLTGLNVNIFTNIFI